ncbi:MAG: hypothetical protein Q4C26_05100 [Bacteroidales bacterium]|nr:hypothetical protein [Bacteroidales bacterium]
MESPFEYNSFATGNYFIGRNKEVALMCNLLRERNNILLYGAPKIGKKSIIYNALEKLRQEGLNFTVCNINLFNIRCIEAFFLRFTNDIFSSFATSSTEWNTLLKKYLPNIPYIVDEGNNNKIKFTYSSKDLLTNSQIEELIALPDRFAADFNIRVVIYFEHFQDFLLFDNPAKILSLMENNFKKLARTTFLFTGEKKNAMDDIFKRQRFFRGMYEEITIKPIEKRYFTDYIIKVFLKSGKVVQPDLADFMYDLVEGDAWYLQHLSAICFDLTKGFLNDKIIEQGLYNLINLYSFSYHYTASTLSKHQLRFLKAILEGVTKFSSADILDKYKLNSSANVNRLKEALTKKEIITFEPNCKEAVFLDPLMKLWFKRYFFEKNRI